MARHFSHRIKVLFQHCDPAGIVFYPRYFEMVNQTVEEWFETGLRHSFAQIHLDEGFGVPTVTISAAFTTPSLMGDMLTWDLVVNKLGRSSVHLTITARCGEALRMTATPVLVFVDMNTKRPAAWPDALRTRLAEYLTDEKNDGE